MSDFQIKKEKRSMKKFEFFIRAAVPGDSKFIMKGVRELVRELRNLDKTPEIDDIEDACKDIINSHSLDKVFVALSDMQEKIGFISVSEQSALHCGGRYVTIQELWVKPEYRSCGVGSQLIQHIEEYSRNAGIKRIDVGLPDYSFPGFSKTYDFYSRNGYLNMGIRMKKVL